MRIPSLVTAATACAVAASAFVVAAAMPASAAPTTCTASDAAIYAAPPASTPGGPGTLISCRSVTLPEVPGNIALSAWKVQLVSTDTTGQRVPSTGLVVVPKAAWRGPGSRPVVAFSPGTLGLGPQCAFSKQLAGAYQDEYEGDNIAALLKAGFAVAASDGQGHVGGDVHPYVAGLAAGHAVLDTARTAFQVPGAGLSPTTKVALWGYSEGGQASLWAAQLAASYAPELKVVGAAAGGVPGDLKLVAQQLDGSPFAGFLADAAVGLTTAYPALPFTKLLNQNGRNAVAKAKSLCLYGTLANFAGAKISSYTTAGYTLPQLYQLAGSNGVTWGQVLDSLKLGVGIGRAGSGAKYQLNFPTFQYRGVAEEIIATSAEDQTRARYCQAGITTQWNQLYPGDHLLTDGQAVNDVVSWFRDRFIGLPTFGNC